MHFPDIFVYFPCDDDELVAEMFKVFGQWEGRAKFSNHVGNVSLDQPK